MTETEKLAYKQGLDKGFKRGKVYTPTPPPARRSRLAPVLFLLVLIAGGVAGWAVTNLAQRDRRIAALSAEVVQLKADGDDARSRAEAAKGEAERVRADQQRALEQTRSAAAQMEARAGEAREKVARDEAESARKAAIVTPGPDDNPTRQGLTLIRESKNIQLAPDGTVVLTGNVLVEGPAFGVTIRFRLLDEHGTLVGTAGDRTDEVLLGRRVWRFRVRTGLSPDQFQRPVLTELGDTVYP